MIIAPIPVRHAERFVAAVHRRLPHAAHRMWAIGLWRDDLVGVIIVGPPAARLFANTRDRTREEWPAPHMRLEVRRCAVREGVPNGCSMLYGAAARGARAMGAQDLLTYTDEDEPGTSLRAAGWLQAPGLYGGGQADRPGRPRKHRENDQRRRRWWAPWSVSALRTRAQEVRS